MTLDQSSTMAPDLADNRIARLEERKGGEASWSTGHIRALDGVRGCAVLSVMLFHFAGVALPAAEGKAAAVVRGITGFGWAGVDLFFVLSGFLITGILLDAKGRDSYFRSFYVRRMLRIFPLYYVVVGFYALAAWWNIAPELLGLKTIHRSVGWLAIYGSNIVDALSGRHEFGPLGHFWSLAIEEHFYLVWPAIVLACSPRRLRGVCVSLILLSPALRSVVIHTTGNSMMTFRFTPCRVDALVCGALLAQVVRSGVKTSDARKWAVIAAGGSLVLLAGIACVRSRFPHYGGTIFTIGFTPLAILFTAVLTLVISESSTSPFRKVLESPPLTSVGKYSYAMYVLHIPLMRPCETLFRSSKLSAMVGSNLLNGLAYIVIAGTATFVAALLSWHLLEKWFLKLKRYFPY